MNVLQLATVDNGGSTWFLKDALERWTECQCRSVRTYQGGCEYPLDILQPTAEEIRQLWDWADVVHLHDEAGALIRENDLDPKPTVITYHGSRYRSAPTQFNALCAKRGWLVTVSTLDLTRWGGRWLPTPRRDLGRFWNPARKWNLIHAPTNRDKKRTNELIEAMGGHVPFTLVEGQTYARCLKKKAKAHALMDGWHYGYGNNSIEAWAFGMPTVSGAYGWLQRMMVDEWGYLPFALADEISMADVIERLRRDVGFYSEVQDRCRGHFMRFHHSPRVAEALVVLYREALDTFAEGQEGQESDE